MLVSDDIPKKDEKKLDSSWSIASLSLPTLNLNRSQLLLLVFELTQLSIVKSLLAEFLDESSTEDFWTDDSEKILPRWMAVSIFKALYNVLY